MVVMSNFLRKAGRFNVVGAVAIVAAGSTLVYSKSSNIIHSRKLELSSYTTNPVLPSLIASCKEASGAVLDDLSKAAAACGPFGRDTIANAAAKVGPAVVHFEFPQYFLGSHVGSRICSGTIIDKDGTILTCAHAVVSSSKGKIEVTLQDGRTFEGKVVNADTESDIAIVKINSETPLPEAKLGSSSRLRPGDWVIAIGSPHFLQNTVTAGILSCVNRKSRDLGMSGMPREYLQADCTTSRGNSGGPLVNMDGEVVGVNIMKAKDVDGFSFSIPIDSVDKVIEHLKKRGSVLQP
ncbi:putative protease Do-like 14 isoform X2 [Lotus japonicus]|uniref:putative protease Do-like 14 isoform X2 n=1 Tax=Lotus japonicus TaxID=34305 RepID=UPI0025837E8D|nr:putative protease Do-like 14 isoform X2 [Lotus japonicus]